MLTLQDPLWLLLALPLTAAALAWRFPTRALRVLRTLLLTLIVLALARPTLRLPERAGTVIVVADRSASMPPDHAERLREAITRVEDAMGPRHRLGIVSFGAEVGIERPPQPRARFTGFVGQVRDDQSRLADAIDTALSVLPPDAPGRLLILSDGAWTGGDPAGGAGRAAARGVALDYRRFARPEVADIAIREFLTPPAATPGEGYLLTAWIQSPTACPLAYTLRRDGVPLAAGTRDIPAGLSRLLFRDRAHAAGTARYELHVQGPDADPVPENNRARALVGIKGPRPILCVSPTATSGLASLLRAGGLDVHAVPASAADWSLDSLSGYAALILENVPANALGDLAMHTVAAWVQQTGSGLMLTGGRQAYGPGGYFGSPLDPVLPVSMELRKEHRKFALAMVVALDRSGSMAAGAGGGRTKMDLANLGTVQVLDLLGPHDELGVIAVDSAPHTIVNLAPVDAVRAQRGEILRIDSMGGGIFVYEALAAASRMLLKAKAGTRHIILFADAADAEEPGAYHALLAECNRAGITVSVVGLGTEQDADAELLREIARLGGGQALFSDQADEIPRLFAQDTFTVARSSFVEEPTGLRTMAGLASLGLTLDGEPPGLGGYNLCYLKPEADLALVSTDEYAAPIVSAWHAGRGRVLCYLGEADGEFAGPLALWPQAGAFFSGLARWTAGRGEAGPDGLFLTQAVRHGACVVQLHLDPARAHDPFRRPPGVTALRGEPGHLPTSESRLMQWVTADLLEVEFPLHGRDTLLASVQVDARAPIPLPPVCLPYAPEFTPDSRARGDDALKRLAAATAGRERLQLADIWADLPASPRHHPLAVWLILAAILVLLLEVLQRRTSAFSRRQPPSASADGSPTPRSERQRFAFPRRSRRSPHSPPPPATSPPTAAGPPPPPPATPHPDTPAADSSTLDALRRARQRANSRLGD